MADEDKDTAEEEAPKPKKSAYKRKAPAKKSVPKATGYAVADGKSISTRGRILVGGDTITADDVADIEALLKGGYVVKA